MAWSFGDSFDLYATVADMANGYWDNAPGGVASNLVAGRFAGSRALTIAQSQLAPVKTSSVNDAVHHLVVSFQQTSAISGASNSQFLSLYDGATAQCTVMFRSDGAILLLSGAWNGTPTLATYTGAFPLANTWYAFEIEIVINNTTGSFAVRKNGNTVNDFSATSLNTRGGTANNYANKLQLGNGPSGATQMLDDLFWQSGAATGNWLGDIRCYARMPASDQSVQFSRLGGATNFSQVSEAQQDGLTSYVFDSNPGDADFYGVGSIAAIPAAVVATTVRAYAQKSDAGTRTLAAQLKSGATIVGSPTLVLSTSAFQWAWRTDLTDPNTGAAWTPAAVNNAQVGPKVIA